jgi:hypothetical protein
VHGSQLWDSGRWRRRWMKGEEESTVWGERDGIAWQEKKYRMWEDKRKEGKEESEKIRIWDRKRRKKKAESVRKYAKIRKLIERWGGIRGKGERVLKTKGSVGECEKKG